MNPIEEYKNPHKDPFLDALNERVKLPNNYTQICCPKCDSELTSEEINIQEKIGKCGSCHVVFPFGDQLEELKITKKTTKPEVIKPEGLEIFYYGDELEISFQQPFVWLEWIMFPIFIMLYIIGLGISIDQKTIWPILVLFALPSFIGFIYSKRRKESHRLFISVNKDYLSILNRPKKLIKDVEYACRDIKQIYAYHRKDLGNWQVRMLIDEGEGQKHVVLATTKSATKAKFIEQEIEANLNIVDAVVKDVN